MHEFPAIRREGFAQKLRKCLKCYVVICAKLRAARKADGAFAAVREILFNNSAFGQHDLTAFQHFVNTS